MWGMIDVIFVFVFFVSLLFVGFMFECVFDVFDSVLMLVGLCIDGCLFVFNSYENCVYQVGIEDGLLVVVKFYCLVCWLDDVIFEEYVFVVEFVVCEILVVFV